MKALGSVDPIRQHGTRYDANPFLLLFVKKFWSKLEMTRCVVVVKFKQCRLCIISLLPQSLEIVLALPPCILHKAFN